MKVERLKPALAFEPIVITLETVEEADYMWAALNCPVPSVRVNQGSNAKTQVSLSTSTLMWEAFDEIHPIGG